MIVAVVGLQREARILDAPGLRVVIGGSDSAALAAKLGEAIAAGAEAIISAGIAGALAGDLHPGDCVVATHIADGQARFAADEAWSAAFAARLPAARRGVIAGANLPAASVEDKQKLRAQTGADAVDMESHIAARAAAAAGLRFAALRVISDGADRTLPKAALVGMKADGAMDVFAVLRALARVPSELGALIRTGRDAEIAFRALAAARAAIGADFALPR